MSESDDRSSERTNVIPLLDFLRARREAEGWAKAPTGTAEEINNKNLDACMQFLVAREKKLLDELGQDAMGDLTNAGKLLETIEMGERLMRVAGLLEWAKGQKS